MTSEKRVEQNLVLHAVKSKCLLFKNNIGSAYRGKPMKLNGKQILTNIMFLRFGLGNIKGGSDQIGITTIKITKDMIGKEVGVFTAIEVKKDKNGSYGATGEQRSFLKMVKERGGISGICDSNDDFDKIILLYKQKT